MVLLLISAGSLTASDEAYVYDQQDAEAQQRQYLVKIEDDLVKCDFAIENTKVLIGRSKNRPYQPTLLMRLAELYIEKSRLIYYLRRSEAQDASGLDQFEANMLKQEAIEVYQQILTHHPDFEECDKVHFFLAHEYRELADLDKMLDEYNEIISAYPDSDYVPESHLLMGDYYFNQKEDLEGSIAQYEAVLRYPDSPSAAIARYKLAWCRINEEDHKGAMALFEEAVKGASATQDMDIDTYQRVDIRLESMIDMAYCYPEVYKKSTTEEAIAYFRQLAWSRPVYATVLEKLASRFYVKKKWQHAAGVYRALSDLREDPEKLLEYTHRIFECVQALGNYDTAEQDVALLIKALEKQKYSVHVDEEEKEKNLANFEVFARETITHLHDKARKTGSREDFSVAADAYGRYLDFFDDHAAAEDMRANYAEALFSAERFLAAGKQYEKLAPAITENRKQRVEALYSAVISYYNALNEKKEEMNFYQSVYARGGLRTSGKLFTTENPNSSRTPDVAFNVAWVAYDAGDYEDAIAEFSQFIETYPTHSAATAAVHLTLDAYYLLEDEDGLVKYGKKILADRRIGDVELRGEIAQIVRGTEAKMVSDMTMAAISDWETGKEELARISESDSETSEQALNALILTAREKKDIATLYDAGMQLAARYPASENLESTMGVLIDTSMKIGQFRLLGDFMEDFGKRYPKNENAMDFILQTARIQEALGSYAAANGNYRRRLSMGPMDTDTLDAVVFAMAENAEKLNKPSEALNIYAEYLSKLGDIARSRAYARMATLYRASGRLTQSKKYAAMARKAFEKKPRYEDVLFREDMGQMSYEEISASSASYFALQFKGDIDNKIFAQKNELLTKLEDGYQEVMGYKSAAWSLRACYRAAELNREFAKFLKESPIPSGLSAAEQDQYRALLSEKAEPYAKKAETYLATSMELAEKSEACDPKLAGYFLPKGAPRGSESAYQAMSPAGTCRRVERNGLTDTTLAPLYEGLLASPEDADLQLTLARVYLDKGDYLQAGLIAQNALSKFGEKKGTTRAELWNLIGVVRLNEGRDALARDAFKQALSADKRLAEAKINLAGLYSHYGHSEKAAELMGGLDRAASISGDKVIHPRAGAYANEIALATP
jgi:tetratricopeptide (TPR) repeat protein